MKRYVIGALSALTLIAMTACSPKATLPTPSAPPPTPTVEQTTAPTPTPTPQLVAPVLSKQTFAQSYTADDGTVVLTVSYTLPDIENKTDTPALGAISDWYANEGAELLSAASSRADGAVGDYEVSAAANFPFQATAEEITFALSYQSDRVVSFTREFYANTVGAAHPTAFRMAEQFALTDGRKLAFTDCFTDALAASDLARSAMLQSGTVASLLQQGVTKADVQAAFQPENFYLTQDGFVFWFQPDALGAGNSPIEVPVPYSALKEYLVEWIA